MAQFDPDTIDEILRVLGYQEPYERILKSTLVEQNFAETVIDRAEVILPQLAKIDQQLFNSLEDTMAIDVGELRLNYPQHYAMLRRQARSLLAELAHLVGMAVIYNKYGNGSASVSYW
jgi:hypothetical protein